MGLDNFQLAHKYLLKAEDRPSASTSVGLASIATAHAVLALLDYLQQDDTDHQESAELNEAYIQDLQATIRIHQRTICQLEEELEATRAALRAREDADAAENEERKTKPHEHRWIDITVMRDLPNRRYVCHACEAAKLVDSDGNEIDSAS